VIRTPLCLAMGKSRIVAGSLGAVALALAGAFPWFRPSNVQEGLPPWLVEDLRTDHAGETGAVWIYHGVLAVATDPKLREFAEHHRDTESKHLTIIEGLLDYPGRSKLLPVWRVAGFLTGALPALLGPAAVYRTIDSVETYVDYHYQYQVDRLQNMTQFEDLRATLMACQADEVEHRDQARDAGGPGREETAPRVWDEIVRVGSMTAIGIARVI